MSAETHDERPGPGGGPRPCRRGPAPDGRARSPAAAPAAPGRALRTHLLVVEQGHDGPVGSVVGGDRAASAVTAAHAEHRLSSRAEAMSSAGAPRRAGGVRSCSMRSQRGDVVRIEPRELAGHEGRQLAFDAAPPAPRPGVRWSCLSRSRPRSLTSRSRWMASCGTRASGWSTRTRSIRPSTEHEPPRQPEVTVEPGVDERRRRRPPRRADANRRCRCRGGASPAGWGSRCGRPRCGEAHGGTAPAGTRHADQSARRGRCTRARRRRPRAPPRRGAEAGLDPAPRRHWPRRGRARASRHEEGAQDSGLLPRGHAGSQAGVNRYRIGGDDKPARRCSAESA